MPANAQHWKDHFFRSQNEVTRDGATDPKQTCTSIYYIAEFEMAKKNVMIAQYPQYREILERMCRC